MKKRSPNIVTFFAQYPMVQNFIWEKEEENSAQSSSVTCLQGKKVLLFIKFSAIFVNSTAALSVIFTLNFKKKNSCFCCYIFLRQCSWNQEWKTKDKIVWNGEVKWHYDYQKHVMSKFSWVIRGKIFKGIISNTDFPAHIREEKNPQLMKTKSILLFLW